jgi:hypothetical protein
VGALGALATVGALLFGAGFVGYRVLGARLTADVYRARLQDVSRQYEQLRTDYNALARRTAITELVVEGDRLRVSVRGATGEIETIETGLDPRKEIFVDYLVLNGQLWIRRVFDEDTPPGQGTFVDPRLVQVDWSDAGARYGKAAYRPLGEGRWIVTMTGDGSLGLERQRADSPRPLEIPAPLLEPEPVERELDAALEHVSPLDLARALLSR